jgi:hypothetical protein
MSIAICESFVKLYSLSTKGIEHRAWSMVYSLNSYRTVS